MFSHVVPGGKREVETVAPGAEFKLGSPTVWPGALLHHAEYSQSHAWGEQEGFRKVTPQSESCTKAVTECVRCMGVAPAVSTFSEILASLGQLTFGVLCLKSQW